MRNGAIVMQSTNSLTGTALSRVQDRSRPVPNAPGIAALRSRSGSDTDGRADFQCIVRQGKHGPSRLFIIPEWCKVPAFLRALRAQSGVGFISKVVAVAPAAIPSQ